MHGFLIKFIQMHNHNYLQKIKQYDSVLFSIIKAFFLHIQIQDVKQWSSYTVYSYHGGILMVYPCFTFGSIVPMQRITRWPCWSCKSSHHRRYWLNSLLWNSCLKSISSSGESTRFLNAVQFLAFVNFNDFI